MKASEVKAAREVADHRARMAAQKAAEKAERQRVRNASAEEYLLAVHKPLRNAQKAALLAARAERNEAAKLQLVAARAAEGSPSPLTGDDG